jgi:hypothetical protein
VDDDDDRPDGVRPPARDGAIHVLSERCSTCIFRPGNLMHLEPGRVRGMVDDSIAAGSAIICHQTLYTPGQDEALCRGFVDSHGHRVQSLQMAGRLGIPTREVEPPH